MKFQDPHPFLFNFSFVPIAMNRLKKESIFYSFLLVAFYQFNKSSSYIMQAIRRLFSEALEIIFKYQLFRLFLYI